MAGFNKSINKAILNALTGVMYPVAIFFSLFLELLYILYYKNTRYILAKDFIHIKFCKKFSEKNIINNELYTI